MVPNMWLDLCSLFIYLLQPLYLMLYGLGWQRTLPTLSVKVVWKELYYYIKILPLCLLRFVILIYCGTSSGTTFSPFSAKRKRFSGRADKPMVGNFLRLQLLLKWGNSLYNLKLNIKLIFRIGFQQSKNWTILELRMCNHLMWKYFPVKANCLSLLHLSEYTFHP